jgi:hypothetical protein
MKNKQIGYIAVQKNQRLLFLPDSIVMTNKRIIICQPKKPGTFQGILLITLGMIEGTL